MKTLLITGFEPFGGQPINPSWEAVKNLPDAIGSYMLCKLEIPVIYGTAAQIVLDKAHEIHADAIICVGQAGGRSAVTPERIAVNIRDAKIADNAGVLHRGDRIAEDGPAAYFATLPVEKMAAAIENAHIPGAVSNTAGCYVCNDLIYTLLHRCQTPACFVHVPYIPEQGEPNLPLCSIVTALTAAIESL